MQISTGELEGSFARSDHDKFSTWRYIKVTCQRSDVNLTRSCLRNSNLSGPVILWIKMTGGVSIRWGYIGNFAIAARF